MSKSSGLYLTLLSLRSQWRIMGELWLSMLSGTAALWTSCVKPRRRREMNLKTLSWRLRRSQNLIYFNIFIKVNFLFSRKLNKVQQKWKETKAVSQNAGCILRRLRSKADYVTARQRRLSQFKCILHHPGFQGWVGVSFMAQPIKEFIVRPKNNSKTLLWHCLK